MPIAVLETVVSSAERRAIRRDEDEVVPRIGDVYASLPAITGKMELEYEGELHGARRIAVDLITTAAGTTYGDPAEGADVSSIVDYFESGGVMQVSEDASAAACVAGFQQVPGLLELAETLGFAPKGSSDGLKAAACELILEGLVSGQQLTRTRGGGYRAANA